MIDGFFRNHFAHQQDIFLFLGTVWVGYLVYSNTVCNVLKIQTPLQLRGILRLSFYDFGTALIVDLHSADGIIPPQCLYDSI